MCPARKRRAAAVLVTLVAAAGPPAGAAGEHHELRLATPVPVAEALAAAAEVWGFELALAPDLPPVELRVDLPPVSRDEALDLLTRPGRAFWWQDQAGVVHVAHDTPNERARWTPRVERSWRLERAVPGEVATALRSLAGAHPVTIEDDTVTAGIAPPLVDLADRAVAALERTGPPGWTLASWRPSGRALGGAAVDPRLGDGPPRRLWFPDPTPVERLYRAIETAWQVEIVVDPGAQDPVPPARLRLPETTLFAAMDAATAPSGRYWLPIGGRRLLVADDEVATRARWARHGLAVFRPRGADPGPLRSALRELHVRSTAYGTQPPVVLVHGTAEDLLIAETVLETLDGGGPLALPDAGRVWLGAGGRPRLAESGLAVDPASSEPRRRRLAALPPPTLAPAPEDPPGPGDSGGGREPGVELRAWLEDRLGLLVADFPCCGAGGPSRRGIDRRAVADRATAVRCLTGEERPFLTVLGPELVRIAPPSDYSRRAAAHQGIAAVPLGLLASAVLPLVEDLDFDATVVLREPRRLLLARGRWDDLGRLLAAAGAGPTAPAARPAACPPAR